MQVVDAHFPAGAGWERAGLFAGLNAQTHLPWPLLAWLFPFAYAAVVAAGFALLECLLYLLRFDRADHAWSSMRWSFRGWAGALAWSLWPPLLAVPIALVFKSLAWVLLIVVAFAPILLPLYLPFFVTKRDYLGAARPAIFSRPRWAGALPWLLMAFVPVGMSFGQLLLPDPLPDWMQPVVVVVVLLIAIFAPLTAQLAWLNRDEGIAQAFRRARQPRVFLPRVVLVLRIECLQLLALAVGLPAAIFLVQLMPELEAQMLQMGSLGLEPFIHASRDATAWWWATWLIFLVLARAWLGWFEIVGLGRLLVESGQVPATAQAGEPSGLRSRK